MDNNQDQDQDELKSNRLIKLVIVSALFFIVLSFFAPFVLTNFSIIDLSNKGTIGDAVGGLMNPFIAIAGVILTFVAFYVQFLANTYQRDQFKTQLDKEKNQFNLQLEEQRKQFSKNQFENQFYEMLSIHRSNIVDLTTFNVNYHFPSFIPLNSTFDEVSGIKSLTYLLIEFELCFKLVEKHWPEIEIKSKIYKAYNLFWNGISKVNEDQHPFFVEALRIKYTFNGTIFRGKSNQLAHYYRQLFQTVKFIVNQEDYSYEEKRNFIRILRSQLPNEEQILLFYNWYSGFGYQWESDENNFFTNYRMIHNIFPNMLVSDDINLKLLFDSQNIMNEEGRKKDSLFEFEDWEE